MRILAAVLDAPGRPVAVEEVELDPPRPDEVQVRVAAAGVCHSDVRLADGVLGEGRWPIVLGHEGAGVVEAVGETIDHVSEGDHVAFCFVPACRECRRCVTGSPNLCELAAVNGRAGTLMDGTSRLRRRNGTVLQHGLMTACFAERTVVARGGVVPIAPELPLWQAALLGCGAVTGSGAVRNVAHVQPGDTVAVIGCGGVGLQVVAAARIAGAAVVVAVDRAHEKLELATAQGATHVVDAGAEDPAAAIRTLTEGGPDVAFEVVGTPATIRLAWDVIRSGGTAVVVGLVPRGVEVAIPAIELLSDKTLRGTYYGSGDPAVELPELADLALTGDLGLESIVTRFCGLDDVQSALDQLRHGEGARTIVVIDAALAGAPSSETEGR